jgi:hypothetical protein
LAEIIILLIVLIIKVWSVTFTGYKKVQESLNIKIKSTIILSPKGSDCSYSGIFASDLISLTIFIRTSELIFIGSYLVSRELALS